MLPDRAIYDEDHRHLRASTRRFIQAEIAPHFDRWETAGIVDRSFWDRAGAAGLLCPTVPEGFGGIGGDFRMNAVVAEELAWSGFAGPAADISVHSDVCLGYLLSHATPEQKARWLPGMVDGSAVCAIAMTEPGTGSDLQGIRTTAVRDGADWVINGQKTFISNGQHADLVIVVTRTYLTERKAFGQAIGDFQALRHRMADLKTDLTVGWAFVDQCITRHCAGELRTYEASMAKLWCSELQGRVVDACVQMHGGYDFMREYEICRMYADARVQRIYGGTSEIMRELISRAL